MDWYAAHLQYACSAHSYTMASGAPYSIVVCFDLVVAPLGLQQAAAGGEVFALLCGVGCSCCAHVGWSSDLLMLARLCPGLSCPGLTEAGLDAERERESRRLEGRPQQQQQRTDRSAHLLRICREWMGGRFSASRLHLAARQVDAVEACSCAMHSVGVCQESRNDPC